MVFGDRNGGRMGVSVDRGEGSGYHMQGGPALLNKYVQSK